MRWLSKSRFRGTVLLSACIFLIGLLEFLISRYRLEAVPDYNKEQDIRVLDSLAGLLQTDAEVLYSSLPPNSEIKERLKRLHPINLNEVDSLTWVSMGLPEKAFESLNRYRKKGGVIRKSEQVFKIPHLPADLALELQKFIRLEKGYPEGRSFSLRGNSDKEPLKPFDLNRADSTLFDQIFGIGRKTAARIVKYRDDLGGFIRKEQLLEIWGLDTLVAEELMDISFISTDFSPRRLNPNLATEEELARHPYIRNGLARLITRYRKQHPPFSKAEDLLGIRLIKPEQLEKMQAYLEFR